MGQILKEDLEDRFFQEVLFLYGGTPRKRREEMIQRFQTEDGPPLFVLSLKAGGFGLNLTQASEEKIDELLEKKKGLAEKIVSAGEDWITELSTRELREIFRLRKEAVME